MSTKGPVLGALAVGALGGFFFATSQTPEPEVQHTVKVVKVPHLITHKEVQVKTVIEPFVLPDTCKSVTHYIKASISKNNSLTTQAKTYFDYVDRLDVRKLSDSNAAHDSEIWLSGRLQKLTTDDYLGLELGEKLKTAWSQCQADIQSQLDR